MTKLTKLKYSENELLRAQYVERVVCRFVSYDLLLKLCAKYQIGYKVFCLLEKRLEMHE